MQYAATEDTLQIGTLFLPDVTQLDAMGPAQMLSRLSGAGMHMNWKSRDPVPTDSDFSLLAFLRR